MTEELESEGKTVAEAVDSALKQLGLPREQVEVQILQEASSGILGFGAKPARVKITRKLWGTPTPSHDKPAPAADARRGAPRRRSAGLREAAGASRRPPGAGRRVRPGRRAAPSPGITAPRPRRARARRPRPGRRSPARDGRAASLGPAAPRSPWTRPRPAPRRRRSSRSCWA